MFLNYKATRTCLFFLKIKFEEKIRENEGKGKEVVKKGVISEAFFVEE
jgi:hypothetical protein